MISISSAPTTEQTRNASAQARAGPPRRILVVEDDTDIRSFNAQVLRRSGYQVDTAEDGEVAWKILDAVSHESDSYELVITDNDMPNVSGVELLRKLCAARMDLPVIMATGTLPVQELGRSLGLQPAAILLKPYCAEDLLSTVSEVLHASESRHEQRSHPHPAGDASYPPLGGSNRGCPAWRASSWRFRRGAGGVCHSNLCCNQHRPLPGERRIACDPSTQAEPQNKMHLSIRSNQTNPDAPNRSPVAQAAHFRNNTLASKLEECRAGSLEEFGGESETFLHFVRLVVNEAAALACSTPYPHLFLPALVDEKLHYARRWKSRQRWVSLAVTMQLA